MGEAWERNGWVRFEAPYRSSPDKSTKAVDRKMRMLIGAEIRLPGIKTARPMEKKKRLPIVARSLFSSGESTGAVNNGVLIITKLINPGA